METLFAKKPEELQALLNLDKTFQAKVIISSILKGVDSFSKITSLPKALRESLYLKYPSTFSARIISRIDSPSAVKLALSLSDGSIIECVRLSDGKGRYTACLSSQVGCAMGCSFCKTGTLGLTRNLKSGEIVEQFVLLENLGEKISNIVFMGMGEPLANFAAVMDACSELHREDGLNISYRKITISTCGVVPGIKSLGELNRPIKLAVSLVSADDESRSKIMRINRSYPLKELKKALLDYQKRQDKRITLEYCMLGGVNTSEESAISLAKFTKGLDVLINLIEWNPIEELPYTSPTERELKAFTSELDKLSIHYTIRRSKGRDSSAACGMLAGKEANKR